MKKLLILFLLFVITSTAVSSNVQEDFKSKAIQILSVNEDAYGMDIEIRIDEPVWADVGLNEELRVAEFTGEGFNDIAGEPLLPVIGRMIRLPISGGAHIELLDSHFQVFSNIEYAAFSGEGLPEELEGLDPSLDMWYPENVVSLDGPGILKDFRVANVSTYPIQVNPARRQVRVYDRLQYRVVYDQSTNENSLNEWPTSLSETFLPFYRQFLDWSESELDQYELYRGGIQLVCPEGSLDEMEEWIEWKKQKGWEVQLLTNNDVSWTRYSIKNELQDRYNAAEIKFDHIVIVGDANGIISTPPGSADGYGAGDHPYGLLAGDDQLLDASIGRISVDSASRLNTYVQKVLAYERDTNRGNTDWYKKGSVAAGSSASGISTVYVARYARHAMLEAGYTRVDTAFYNDGGGPVNNRIINQLNSGVGFHLYRGFIGSGIETDAIGSLSNTNKIPVVVDITCGRGNWADGYSINEAYMRAGSANQPRGAIGAVCTATSSTHTRFNNALAGGAVEAVFTQKLPTVGQMLIGAKFNMWKNFNGFQDNGVYEFNQWLNLMGDPTVWIFTDIPDSTLQFHVDDELELGSRGVELTIVNDDGPVENAWVTFYKSDNDEEVISRAVSDENGHVFLNIPFEYAGEAVLTVTAYNHRPKQQFILISEPDEKLGVLGYTVLDNGSQGTVGNGNGIAEAGETVGLQFQIRNFGLSSQSNINISASSEDEFIVSVSGTAQMTSLASGSNATFNTPILAEIDPNAPNDWTAVFNVSLVGSEGNYPDFHGIKILAPDLIFVQANGNILPGQQGTINFNIVNIGGADSPNTTVVLQIEDFYEEWITVDVDEGSLGALSSGNSANSSDFTLTGSSDAFKGYVVSGRLLADYPNGRRQDIPVKISMGNKNVGDPEGPDSYGYFAYDNTDYGYIMSPPFNWVEINPDAEAPMYDGTRIPLTDTGENMDDSRAINLPFDFTYYGETYNTITVCSNGWIAMDNQEGMALQRNWVIPSPLGPWAMIAPFWDDRIISNTNTGVYYHYLEEEGKFVVEWSDVSDAVGSGISTFQVILMEYSEEFPTPTGDNEFIFQYKEINPTIGGYSDVPYWTTGIENANQTDGLQLSYYDIPSDATSPIDDNRSILFSTRTSFVTGQVSGTVTHLSDDSPVSDVIVISSVLGTADTTGTDGNYSIAVASGISDIIFRKDGYVTFVEEGVDIPEEGNVNLDAQMVRPLIDVTPEELIFNLNPGDSDSQMLTFENSGDATLTYGLTRLGRDPESGAGGDVGEQVELINLPSGTFEYHDLASQGDTLWVLGQDWNSGNTELRLYDFNGMMLDSYGVVFGNEVRRVQVDGNIIVLGSNDQLKFYTFDDGLYLDSTKTLQTSAWDNDFAVDFANQKIYQSFNSMVYEYNMGMQFQDLHQFGELNIMGIDVIPDDPEGFTLHILGYIWDMTGERLMMVRFNPETSAQEIMFETTLGMGNWGRGMSLIKSNNGMNIMVGILFPYNDTPSIGIYVYMNRLDWLSLDQESGTLEPESSDIVNVSVDATTLPQGIYNAWIAIRHNAAGGRLNIPLTINVGSVDVDEKNLPLDWTLDGVYPNPFNPVATVRFSLMESVQVKAKLFNVLGQQVAVLANRPMQAGTHSLSINGENLSSGVYFLKFNAGPLSSVQKVVLMK